MPCYRPLEGYQVEPGGPLLFGSRYRGHELVTVGCQQCIGCKLEHTRQWAVRCMHENKYWGDGNSSFVTLTYQGELSIAQRSLTYGHFQDFMKRLISWERRTARREKRPQKKFRHFTGGEYGEDRQRPHWHSILFNVRFADAVYLRKSPSGETLLRSPTLEKLWPHGYSSIGQVTFESAAYVARYTMKKITGVRYATGWHPYIRVDPETGEEFEVAPEVGHMSLKPGIGALWLQKFRSDVYPEGKVVSRGKLANAPAYYDSLQAKVDPTVIEDLKFTRLKEGKARFSESSPERLSVREAVARARLSLSKRKIQ